MHYETVKKTLSNVPVKIFLSTKNHYYETVNKSGLYLLSDMHFHDEIEILYIREGSYFIEIPGKKYSIEPGSTVFVRTGTPHSTMTRSLSGAYDFIQFRLEDYFNSAEKYAYKYLPILAAYEDAPPVVVFEKGSEICSLMQEIINEYSNKNTALIIEFTIC